MPLNSCITSKRRTWYQLYEPFQANILQLRNIFVCPVTLFDHWNTFLCCHLGMCSNSNLQLKITPSCIYVFAYTCKLADVIGCDTTIYILFKFLVKQRLWLLDSDQLGCVKCLIVNLSHRYNMRLFELPLNCRVI